MIRPTVVALRTLVRATCLLGVLAGIAGAQGPKVFYACYVPTTGTVYRIKEPDTPTSCGVSLAKGKNGVDQPHVEFSWTDGAGAGTTDHGALTGLTDDDHSQYLLTNGVRNTADGFAVIGTLGVGSIPTTGPNTRMMWYPGKGAFRVGTAFGTQWDDAQIGVFSMALGTNTIASADGSVAIGNDSRAFGYASMALHGGRATGGLAFAVAEGLASGERAVAIGRQTTASGLYSMALGYGANTNGKTGAFVWGDLNSGGGADILALVDNQFVARASKFWFGSNNNVTAVAGRLIETSTGAYLSTGGAWTNSSDSARKTTFAAVDGEQVLAKLAAMPVSTWSYKDEDASVRHMGPTAQDFAAAFALGSSDKAIATVDADGVSLAAIKALVSRTAELQERVSQLEAALERLTAAHGVARK